MSGQVPNATAGHRCPHCRKKLDGYTSVGEPDAVPEPGALSICGYCGTFGVYVEGGIDRLLAKDFDSLPRTPGAGYPAGVDVVVSVRVTGERL